MPTLIYCDTDGVDRSLELGAAGVTVGRNPDCNVRSEDGRVSRRHARFFVDGGWVWVEDLGSANGVWVGPQRVAQRLPVPFGELVVAGSLLIRVSDPQRPPQVTAGVHAQLSEWLVTERRLRKSLEAERDAFARRVGEVHDELARAKAAAASAAEGAERRAGELERRAAEAERRAREAAARAAAAAATPAADPQQAARVAELEAQLALLRRRLTETDAELDELDRLKAELARRPAAAPAAPALPPGFAEQVAALSDSLSSLRGSMRAISDETAVMEQSESLQVVSAAVAAAMEELERARDAVRALAP
jgi:hypothetical protein